MPGPTSPFDRRLLAPKRSSIALASAVWERAGPPPWSPTPCGSSWTAGAERHRPTHLPVQLRSGQRQPALSSRGDTAGTGSLVPIIEDKDRIEAILSASLTRLDCPAPAEHRASPGGPPGFAPVPTEPVSSCA